ncbi:MAG: hypothetical protein M3N98_00395, partial [Actinomycetota bacterium]|nr:hypothetical protein [Actinomycetota bacterium]
PHQRAAATDVLVRTESATAPYADLAKATAAGFDLQASLAKAEQKHPDWPTCSSASTPAARPLPGCPCCTWPTRPIGPTARFSTRPRPRP